MLLQPELPHALLHAAGSPLQVRLLQPGLPAQRRQSDVAPPAAMVALLHASCPVHSMVHG